MNTQKIRERDRQKEERKCLVLGHIVGSYVSSASPVSSKIVARMMGGDISSATVRNIMGELEDSGYIEQPHTSAGRIPTHLGYRHYVDMVKDRIRFEQNQAQRLASEYTKHIRTMKEVIEKTSFLISRELHNAGIVMWPSIGDFYLKHIELIKLRSETVLAVLITMTNAVQNYIIKLSEDLEKGELEKITNYINSNYECEAFSGIPGDIKSFVQDAPQGNPRDIASSALEIINFIIGENIGNDIYWEGLDYFADEPEFRDMNITRRLLKMFSERKDLARLMRNELPYRGLKIYIGKESDCEVLSECSVVTCGYTLHGKTAGRLGVVGPTRMNYDNALRTVSCLADLVSLKLEEING